jgi:hypothetical protein
MDERPGTFPGVFRFGLAERAGSGKWAMAAGGITGGCQCGAVRYRMTAPPDRTGVCFCRMCQKASGNYSAAHSSTTEANLIWTKGRLALFRSSEAVERGYCRDCGTPLTYAVRGSGRISVTSGTLDDPSAFPPSTAYGVEGRLPWFDEVCRLEGPRTEDDIPAADLPRFRSRQHPDHE